MPSTVAVATTSTKFIMIITGTKWGFQKGTLRSTHILAKFYIAAYIYVLLLFSLVNLNKSHDQRTAN